MPSVRNISVENNKADRNSDSKILLLNLSMCQAEIPIACGSHNFHPQKLRINLPIPWDFTNAWRLNAEYKI